jgi:sec-independent protein translocase protein TatA
MLQGIGAPEILIILLILVLLFGAKKLPELAKGAGESLRIFKSEVKADDDVNDGDKPAALETRAVETSPDAAAEKKPEQQG